MLYVFNSLVPVRGTKSTLLAPKLPPKPCMASVIDFAYDSAGTMTFTLDDLLDTHNRRSPKISDDYGHCSLLSVRIKKHK